MPYSTEDLGSHNLAQLPTQGVNNGATAFCENGRKSGEGAALGTGLLVWFDKTSGTWIDPRTSTEVTV
ncbi:MAG: hypothetical protein O2976_05705 [Actinomycetota bacterium]|nr:hypothetical protein [Actinomycetota bacterium]